MKLYVMKKCITQSNDGDSYNINSSFCYQFSNKNKDLLPFFALF